MKSLRETLGLVKGPGLSAVVLLLIQVIMIVHNPHIDYLKEQLLPSLCSGGAPPTPVATDWADVPWPEQPRVPIGPRFLGFGEVPPLAQGPSPNIPDVAANVCDDWKDVNKTFVDRNPRPSPLA
ncbi:hypothetical protein GGR57DRAFT_508311 [Xylariaceae sp. FL1272]|nr:hypothetical protein GGR57DRAFT_508311 [Xylariaceae sp. FL1272]